MIADTCILYEITKYKDESVDDDFWDTYMDFFELGEDENLIRGDKLDLRALSKKKRLEYLLAQTRNFIGGNSSEEETHQQKTNSVLEEF